MVCGVSGQLVLNHVVEVRRKEVVQIQSLQMEEGIVMHNIFTIHGIATIKNALAVEDTHLEKIEDTHLKKIEDPHLEKIEDTHLEKIEDTHLEKMEDTNLEMMEATTLEVMEATNLEVME